MNAKVCHATQNIYKKTTELNEENQTNATESQCLSFFQDSCTDARLSQAAASAVTELTTADLLASLTKMGLRTQPRKV